jgi:hypothetical protein
MADVIFLQKKEQERLMPERLMSCLFSQERLMPDRSLLLTL